MTEEVVKKRGRKPKGGKIIAKPIEKEDTKATVINVILHLKCAMSEMDTVNEKFIQPTPEQIVDNTAYEYVPFVPSEIIPYEAPDQMFAEFHNKTDISANPLPYDDIPDTDSSLSMKEINKKLKQIKLSLYKNNLSDKKSACFWCTCDYDNDTCYIPKYDFGGNIHGYGAFCRPECGVAYLFKEIIDDSVKFERYQLLNMVYGQIYGYTKNIKPAPDPHYLLDKFYGNLTIQEYRKLLKSEHMLVIVDKPMTRNLPELHEDTEDLIYRVKRQSERTQETSKINILRDKFNIKVDERKN